MSDLPITTAPAAQSGFATGVDEQLNVAPPASQTQVPPTPPAPQQQGSSRMFTAEEIENARRQEKDKLYPRIDEMANELKVLREEREERLRQEEQARAEAAEAQRLAQEAEMSARELIEQKDREWNQRFAEVQAERDRQSALLEQERRFSQLTEYRNRRLAEEQNNIAPQLLDLVGGNSEEEIEASIALMRQKTDAILTSVAEAQRGQRQAQPTARATQPPVGPMETDQLQESYSPAEIAAMDMHTYQKLRPQLLAASSQQYRQGTPS